MKRFVLGIVVICWTTIVFAAGDGSKVTGILSGKTNKAPVEFATIALYEATTQKLVAGAMTDSIGCFHLEDVPTEISGSYNRRHFLRRERIESVTEDLNHHLEDFYFLNRRADAKENMWEGNFLYTFVGTVWKVVI